MKLSMIAAMAKNKVIGVEGKMPWHIPSELALFKKYTLGKILIMGRVTYESLPSTLPDRKIIVLTSHPKDDGDFIYYAGSINEALFRAECLTRNKDIEVVIAGGESLYKEFIDKVDNIYLSVLKEKYEGDRYFPDIPKTYKLLSREEYPAYTFNIYYREKQNDKE